MHEIMIVIAHSIGTTVIEGPTEVIYRPGDDPIELTCNITIGITGWTTNGGEDKFTIPEIRNGALPGHTINGTNLVVVNATNNTQYICYSITDSVIIPIAPVYLYIAGMLCVSTPEAINS